MVIGQIMPTNPAAAVRGPRHIVRRGKTPVLDPAEARQLLDAIDPTTVIGLRDRALIGLMVYSFARIGAAIGMRVEDVYTQNRRLWVRLHEKGTSARPADSRQRLHRWRGRRPGLIVARLRYVQRGCLSGLEAVGRAT
jgi:integrase